MILPPRKYLLTAIGVLVLDAMTAYAVLSAHWQSPRSSQSAASSAAVELDQYGGLKTLPSSNQPTLGRWRVEKFGKRWMFVDPANNAYFMIGMYALDQDDSPDTVTYYARTAQKYGDSGPSWGKWQVARIKSWGFNGLGIASSTYVLPVSNPNKIPFWGWVRPAYYAMANTNHHAPAPIKNLMLGASSYYRGYRPSEGIGDYYDENLATYLQNLLNDDYLMRQIRQSPNRSYMIGVAADDSDEMFGFGAGPDFPTVPPGHNNSHLGWVTLTMSPIQSANAAKKAVYSDTVVYSKKALRDQLAKKYRTIEALNRAWSSTYTTFDSNGTQIRDERLGAGNGDNRSFAKIVTNTRVTPLTVQVFEGSKLVAGDIGEGKIWGPEVTGSIGYENGSLSIAFASGHAPPRGTEIKINYVANGWGIGSGLLDEDGRPAHKWMGKDFTSLRDVQQQVKADLDDFLYQLASHYFSLCKTQIQAWTPGLLFLGPDSLGTWGAPSSAKVLQAASNYVDVMIMGSGSPMNQSELDYIYRNFGDKPMLIGTFQTANADSAFFSYPASNPRYDFASQSARGEAYARSVRQYVADNYSASGTRPYVGVLWWQYLDNRGEHNNWGLVSLLDNAYDGHEAAQMKVPCSAPLAYFNCGGETRNYGDVVSEVSRAHQQLLRTVQLP